MVNRPPFYKSRSLRTVILAIVATACFVGSAILVFDVEPRVMWAFFFTSLLGLALIIVAAMAVVGVKVLITRWLDK